MKIVFAMDIQLLRKMTQPNKLKMRKKKIK